MRRYFLILIVETHNSFWHRWNPFLQNSSFQTRGRKWHNHHVTRYNLASQMHEEAWSPRNIHQLRSLVIYRLSMNKNTIKRMVVGKYGVLPVHITQLILEELYPRDTFFFGRCELPKKGTSIESRGLIEKNLLTTSLAELQPMVTTYETSEITSVRQLHGFNINHG